MIYEKYLARKSKDNREQTVEDHLQKTANLAEGFFKREKPVPELDRLAKLARAAARWHDLGKFSNELFSVNAISTNRRNNERTRSAA